jgi:hypothetical protein
MSRHTRVALARPRSDRSGGVRPRGLAPRAPRPGRRDRRVRARPVRGERGGRNVGPVRVSSGSFPRGRSGRASPGEADETVGPVRVSSGSLPAGPAWTRLAGRGGRNGRSSARFIRLAPRRAGLDAPRRTSRTKRSTLRAFHPFVSRGVGLDAPRRARRTKRPVQCACHPVGFRGVGLDAPRRARRTKRSVQRACHPARSPRGRSGRASPGEPDETVAPARVSSGSRPTEPTRAPPTKRAGSNGRSSARSVQVADQAASEREPRAHPTPQDGRPPRPARTHPASLAAVQTTKHPATTDPRAERARPPNPPGHGPPAADNDPGRPPDHPPQTTTPAGRRTTRRRQRPRPPPGDPPQRTPPRAHPDGDAASRP